MVTSHDQSFLPSALESTEMAAGHWASDQIVAVYVIGDTQNNRA